MSGNEELGVSQLREKIDNLLTNYIDRLVVVGNPNADGTVDAITGMEQQELRSLSPQDAADMAFVLKRQAMKIKIEQNLHKARVQWAKGKIMHMMAKTEFGQYDKYELRPYILAQSNSYVKDLLQVIEYAEMYATMLDGVADGIRYISATLEEICRTKRYV